MKYLEYDIFSVKNHYYRYQARDHLHVLNIEEKMMTGPTLEIFLSITAFLGNTLIFTALRRKNSLYKVCE